jgi:CubicO group peptidase (beta-lactamase class C family)
VLTFRARDGADVYARLFTPEMLGARRDPASPGVVFVHGAGYAQNAHKYWSTYYREYMFDNLLASRGYVVLDVDYRASSGYGRDWRTAIYRHMGYLAFGLYGQEIWVIPDLDLVAVLTGDVGWCCGVWRCRRHREVNARVHVNGAESAPGSQRSRAC